jgi:hypothetical protein
VRAICAPFRKWEIGAVHLFHSDVQYVFRRSWAEEHSGTGDKPLASGVGLGARDAAQAQTAGGATVGEDETNNDHSMHCKNDNLQRAARSSAPQCRVKASKLLAVLRRKALPVFDGSEKNAARVGRAPIAGDLDLRGVGAEELRVWSVLYSRMRCYPFALEIVLIRIDE